MKSAITGAPSAGSEELVLATLMPGCVGWAVLSPFKDHALDAID